MSWKSLLSAGLVCVLAAPVLAAPTLSVNLHGLNAAGNWVWRVQIAPSNPIPGTSTPLAAELGFRETTSAELLAATRLNPTGNFDTVNPGTQIFTWETAGTGTNGKPEGLQVNLPTDEVFAALGSVDFSTIGPKDFIDIEVQRPSSARLTTTMQVLGAYGSNGRIAENNPAGTPPTINHDTFASTTARAVRSGNANLDGTVDVVDLGRLASSYNVLTGKRWQDGDFSGDGAVDVVDLGQLASNYNQPDTNWTTPGVVAPGAGSGSAAGVPEPSTMILVLMGGLLSVLGARRRTS